MEVNFKLLAEEKKENGGVAQLSTKLDLIPEKKSALLCSIFKSVFQKL